MPVPKPNKDEKKNDFISRCMGDDNMQEYDQDQRSAICYTAWKDKDKVKATTDVPKEDADGDFDGDTEALSQKFLVKDADGKDHLPYTDESGKPDHRLMGAAWAALHGGYRGNKYDGPNKEAAIDKLKSLYKSENMETPDSVKATDDLGLLHLSEVKDGLVRIAIAYTGDFEKGGKPFKITANDLKDIQKNLRGREAPIDYEHLSAQPGSPPGHTRASGWFKSPDRIEDFGTGRQILWGWAEFTPAALAAIRMKEYKYFSPEIHWHASDEKGKEIGTKLDAGAITNRPFLKDLPPIEIAANDYPQLLEAVALSEHQRLIDIGDVHVPGPTNKPKEVPLKNLFVKKLSDGDNKGKHGIFDAETLVGLADDASLKLCTLTDDEELTSLRDFKTKTMAELTALRQFKADHEKDAEELTELRALKASLKAKAGDLYIKHEDDNDVDENKKQMTATLTDLGVRIMTIDPKIEEERQAKEAASAAEIACLTEFSKTTPGEATVTLAEKLLRENKLTTAGYLRHQKIERMLDNAVAKRLLLPKQRENMYKLAISDFEAAVALLNDAKPVIDTTVRGIEGNGDSMKASQELEALVVARMKDKNVPRHEALREVTRENPGLWDQHTRETAILTEK